MFATHRIRLDPNNVQATYLARAAGTARFAYNWALAEWLKQYAAYKADPKLAKPSEAALRRQLNAIKRSEFPWMLEIAKNAPQMAITQLGRAFQNFFAKRAGFPTFRRKGRDERFSLTNEAFRVKDKLIRIPKLGWVRMHESVRYVGHILSATISRVAGHWYASITVEMSEPSLPLAETQGAVGVDLGITTLATLSNGEKITGPRPLSKLLKRLRRQSRNMSRKVKRSCNWMKAKLKLARLHDRIANIRRNSLHQLSNDLTRRFHTIGIEDLNVKGMLANGRLARVISDMGFHELRRQLEYKSAWRGRELLIADRWYPSSKMCSSCKHKLHDLTLGVRQWTCPLCGTTHDRDVNAAINLKNMAVSFTVSACGGEGTGHTRKHEAKPAPMKQESNSKVGST